jgi:hypothetical protein
MGGWRRSRNNRKSIASVIRVEVGRNSSSIIIIRIRIIIRGRYLGGGGAEEGAHETFSGGLRSGGLAVRGRGGQGRAEVLDGHLGR